MVMFFLQEFFFFFLSLLLLSGFVTNCGHPSSQVCSFIHLFIIHSFKGIYYNLLCPGTELGAGDIIVNTGTALPLWRAQHREGDKVYHKW